MPVRADVAVVMDAEAAALGAQIDQVDSALALIYALRQSRELDQRHYHLARNRGVPTEFPGTYRTLLPFSSSDGLPFEVGTLIDASLVGPGMLHRLQIGRRHIMPVEFA